jgi:CBS domain-containing protein
MKVREAVNTQVVRIESNANLAEAAQKMDDYGVSVLAVVSDDGNPAGLVTARQLAATAENANPATTPVETAVPDEMTGCYGDVELVEAIQIMMLMRIRHMPVFDEKNDLIGFLSAEPRTHDIH